MSLPRYESYKDSGVEWLGKVPEHWVISKFSYVKTVLTDYTANGSFADLKTNVIYRDEPSYARLVRLTDLRVNLENENGVWIDEHSYNFLRKSALFGGEFLLANVGAYAGLFYQMPYNKGMSSLAPNMLMAKFVVHKIYPEFMAYVGQSDCVNKQLRLSATASSAQPKLNKDDFNSVKFAYTAIEEQEQICTFLNQETAKIDNLIGEQQLLIKLLKEKRQAVISHAVTKGLNPDVTMKDSGVEWLGEVPEHWNIVKLKQIASIQNGRDYKHIETEFNGYPVIGSGGTFTRASEFIYSGESVLLGRKGTINKPLYINESFWVVDTMFYTKINPQYSAKYLYYCSLTIHFDYYSTSTALPSMTQESLGNIFFAISSLDEQQKIAQFLDQETAKIDNLIAESTNLISLSKERRSALISSAVTGKIDVRNYVPSQPNVEAMT